MKILYKYYSEYLDEILENTDVRHADVIINGDYVVIKDEDGHNIFNEKMDNYVSDEIHKHLKLLKSPQ